MPVYFDHAECALAAGRRDQRVHATAGHERSTFGIDDFYDRIVETARVRDRALAALFHALRDRLQGVACAAVLTFLDRQIAN